MLCGALAKFLKVTLYPMGLVISGGFSWCPFLGPEGIPHPEGIKITHPPPPHTHTSCTLQFLPLEYGVGMLSISP